MSYRLNTSHLSNLCLNEIALRGINTGYSSIDDADWETLINDGEPMSKSYSSPDFDYGLDDELYCSIIDNN